MKQINLKEIINKGSTYNIAEINNIMNNNIICGCWGTYNIAEINNIMNNNIICGCWGIHNFRNIESKILIFNVDGFILKGKVYIYIKNDLFNIIFTDQNDIIKKELNGIYIEDLIDSIDYVVEKNCSDEEYNAKVKKLNDSKNILFRGNINKIFYN